MDLNRAGHAAEHAYRRDQFVMPQGLVYLAGNSLGPAVADYVLGQVDATEFLDRALAMFEPVLAGYAREGRRYATVAIGCTGGKHRSVAMTEALAARFDPERVVAFVVHRDLGRE